MVTPPRRNRFRQILLTERRRLIIALLAALFFALIYALWLLQSLQPQTYFVDCEAGRDRHNGRSESRAWQTIERANGAALRAGDSLLFKRGCTWNQRFEASWIGTAEKPVTIGAYGEGELPSIENGENQNVQITGSHLIIEYLSVRSDSIQLDPNCNDQPLGSYVGFNFMHGARYNILRYSEASEQMAGVRIASGSSHNQILHNRLTNNHVMQRWLKGEVTDDLGAWGILVNGTDNEIAYNLLADNNALCTYGEYRHGNSIELYQAQRNRIHHNTAYNDRVFSEVGGSVERRSADNLYAYNLHVTDEPRARFLVVRGKNDKWGPTWRTTALNNTVYLTNSTSQGVVCHSGCTGEILELTNNIIWAEQKVLFADAPFKEANNIYWQSDAAPVLDLTDFQISESSRIVDPLFIDASEQDFRLSADSPAIDAGTLGPRARVFTADLGGAAILQDAALDIGAFEAGSTQRGDAAR